jgi:hypothetical protein
MPVTLIRGSQLQDATVTLAKLVSGWDAGLLKANGSVAPSADLPMSNFKITGLGDAIAAQDAVNLRTMQSYINGLAVKPICQLVVTANVALTGVQTFDSVSATAGYVVLLTAQATQSQNGPWITAAGAWSRPTWWAAASVQKPCLFLVSEGTNNHDTKWMTITDGNITVDTTSITITQDLSGTTYANGNGISLTGNVFAVKNGNGITFDGSNNIQVNPDANGLLSVSGTGVRIAAGTSAQLIVANGSGNPAWATMSGDVTISNAGVTSINRVAGSGFLKYADIVNNETPGGAINGSNVTFTLANTPQGGISLYYNGALMRPGAGNDYTLSGTTITMAFAPLSTGVLDTLVANYIK